MDALCLLDDRFDLSGFYSLTVDLDHPVSAVQKQDAAVFASSDDIACFQELCKTVLFFERIVNKGFCCLFIQVQITVCKASAKA